ncbi:MAG: DoxX family protein [Pseudomonadota bacterium]
MPLPQILITLQCRLDATRVADWLAPLLLRLYLAPIFWMAGWNKLMAFSSTVEWFGDKDWGLGLPFPTLMAALATASELGGAVLLVLGLGVRWVSLPLMATMVVAAFTVHLPNGWLAIAEGMGPFATERTAEAVQRLAKAKEILMEHGNYEWITEHGSLAILNNGIEFAVTYFVMLLVLFFVGAGRYVSLDYWIARRFMHRLVASSSAGAA